MFDDHLVARCQPFPGVHEEEDVVRLADGPVGLVFREGIYALLGAAQSPRVHDHVGFGPDLADAVLAVARQARLIGHQGVACARQPVEQG